jgi:murein DD-endopeptidase MepM/ murein hydrolase activator NlpD
MPSGCFRPVVQRIVAVGAALFASGIAADGIAVFGIPASGFAQPMSQARPGQNPWRLGVFPVTVFSGYTSSFGGRTGPWGAIEPHYGLDIAAPLGSPIRNWWGGTVKEVIHDGRCGVGLVIQSGPYEHIYCHLLGSGADGVYRCGGLQLQPGQRVRTGQLIARVGMSGRTTGPHLHWGMRYGGQWLDPAVILRAMARSRGAAARP